MLPTGAVIWQLRRVARIVCDRSRRWGRTKIYYGDYKGVRRARRRTGDL